jgi:hypothetical protein
MFQTLFTSTFDVPKMVAVPIILKKHWKEIVTAIALPFIFAENINARSINVENKSKTVSPGNMYVVHEEGATENYDGYYDAIYPDWDPNPLHIYSHNDDGLNYMLDARPANSITTYDLHLKNTGFSGTADNFLRFKMIYDSNFLWKNIFLGDANDSNDVVADIKYIIYNGDISPTGKPYGDFPLPDIEGSNVGVYDKRKVFFFNHADFNRDRHIDDLDFAIFSENFGRDNVSDPNTFGSYVGSEPNNFNAYADINRNGSVGLEDLDIFKTYFKFPGDLNLDGRVGLPDFAYFAPYWGARDVNSIADISGPNGIPDKNVNFYDLEAFAGDYLRDINEPSTWSRMR